ncbi:leucine rich repeat (LRR) protein [Chitinophaga polysaccharea]|uniref:Leucine rich repeat (LRR) protein n=1 Tax=Chitinophaga polysaccharea TaxID=1293035 RepID=A0A561PQD7_9BACT|nr:leucine rich repeat (LRR) protein [Chitinophaga polysaccharea]
MEKVSNHLGRLIQLRTLNLFDNKLTDIPESIGCLTELDYLQLGMNKIDYLPESIGHCANIRHFEVFSNALTKIPLQLKKVSHLESLNIADNQITRIENVPDQIHRLSIYSNPVDYINPQTLERFQALIAENFNEYLYVDSLQYGNLGLQKSRFQKDKLKIIDIPSGQIYWSNYKDMPIALTKKWGLQISRDRNTVH